MLDLEATTGDEVIYAFIADAYILDQSRGGVSTEAVNIPFNVKIAGAQVEADYDIATEQFTSI